TSHPGTFVTVVLPRRSYPVLLGRLLHDQTADKIARVVSRIPRSAATILPFDVEARLEVLHERQAGGGAKIAKPAASVREQDLAVVRPGVTPIASLAGHGRATVEGRVHSLEIRPVEHSCVLACQVTDGTGEMTALFYGRTHIPGLEPGTMIQLRGRVGVKDTGTVMVNPAYELLS
ncbi:MAG TPA: OB-fold nucleic acid binding domain-containing protein, partial [Streptosporangiaceae bacterium]|nr:OB-fold nucleic acid binding domain-containing protein [Streptosporangiaceae bacterium]